MFRDLVFASKLDYSQLSISEAIEPLRKKDQELSVMGVLFYNTERILVAKGCVETVKGTEEGMMGDVELERESRDWRRTSGTML